MVYSTNCEDDDTAPHVRHRTFTTWVQANCPQWELADISQGPNEGMPGRADFFTYRRV